MTTPEEDYERRLENMRAALARAWEEGYYRGADLEMPQSNVVNPYAKEK